tara:strand:- start:4447 stop:5229 length:783 start_codon:yes stop_codon:yes gene_type:complete
MAELHRVEINEKTPGEIEPEEEEVKSEEGTQDAPDEDAETTDPVEETPEGEQERPEWLPEKFKTAEDMAKAYSELEKKMGNKEEGDTPESEVEPSEAAGIVTEASKEFFEKGELTDDTYESLSKLGLSKELVDSFAAGQAALQENQANAIKGEAGSDYDAMTEWAGTALTDEEMDAFNQAVTTGTVEQAKFAVKGLHARYRAEVGGTGPKQLLKGETSGTGSVPFQSMQEVRRAMMDPRYKEGDKAYHAMIDRRLAVSNL